MMLGKDCVSMARRALQFHVEVSSPCSEAWDAMKGTARQRHCAQCNKQVHNFARMTPREIAQLAVQTGGHLCGRITNREDGSLVTLEPGRHSLPLANIAISTALMVVPAAALAQTDHASTASQQSTPESKASATSQPHVSGLTGKVTGVVTDPASQGVAGVPVQLLSGDDVVASALTDETGRYSLTAPSAKYELRVVPTGFRTYSTQIVLHAKRETVANTQLSLGELMGVVVMTHDRKYWLRHPVQYLIYARNRYL